MQAVCIACQESGAYSRVSACQGTHRESYTQILCSDSDQQLSAGCKQSHNTETKKLKDWAQVRLYISWLLRPICDAVPPGPPSTYPAEGEDGDDTGL